MGGGENRRHGDTDSLVRVLVANDLGRRRLCLERKAVTEVDDGDFSCDLEHGVGVVGNQSRLQVDVAGRPPQAVCGKEDAAFQDELRFVA